MKHIYEQLKDTETPWFCVGKHMEVMYKTGPNFLHNVLLNSKHLYIILPRKLFYPYSSSEDKMITESYEEIVIRPIKNTSGSWHSIDSIIYSFIKKHKEFFILLGILFAILIVLFLFHYMSKYQKCKESKDKCEKKCKF
jgi:hypothetical protein